MTALLAFVLAAMEMLAPGRDHSEIGSAIARVVESEPPLFPGDEDRRRTASLLVAISFRESSFRNDVVSKTHDYCHLQVNRRPDLAEDVERCTRVGLDMLRTSIRVCPKSPVSWYAVGGPRSRACTSPRGLRISADRMALARRVYAAATAALAAESVLRRDVDQHIEARGADLHGLSRVAARDHGAAGLRDDDTEGEDEMSETTIENANAEAPPPPVGWQEVAAASAEAQTPDEEVDFVEDKILVELTDAEVLARSRMNKDRLDERTQLEGELETKRAEAKAIKGEIDELQKEIDQCTTEMGTRRAYVTKRWRVVSHFRTNTERWYDPDDGRLVDERAIPTNRRQTSLPFAKAIAAEETTTADEGAEEAATVDDDTEIDATEILDATPPLAAVSETPSQPTRRGRRRASP